ncbi:hypothetical protein ACIOWK_34660 [Pseudomonas protegens]|uniref:hypothetical protein n=1 Tax=Pseudomonas TaxID=286 RepID=UPI001F469CB3|nr:hypothetical protein [Pseudomonas sp. BC42]ULT73025.1 hypothetical protein L1O02_11865 [Pseudomonas sp. BC42]
MSDERRVFANEAAAWDQYAAAALGATIVGSKSSEQAVQVAADLADGLLRERQKRTKAAGDYLSSKTK